MTLEDYKIIIAELHRVDNYLKMLVEDATDWGITYDLVFSVYNKVVHPLLEDLGLSFTYADPDSTYEEDVLAFVNTFNEFVNSLPKESK
jgi:hypothetical protein